MKNLGAIASFFLKTQETHGSFCQINEQSESWQANSELGAVHCNKPWLSCPPHHFVWPTNSVSTPARCEAVVLCLWGTAGVGLLQEGPSVGLPDAVTPGCTWPLC